MQNLKKNKYFFFLFLSLIGCITPFYHIIHQKGDATELSVTPDRVILECEWLYDATIKGLYGFMIHVLDEKETVLTVNQGNTLNKEGCDNRIKKISEILKKGKQIYIAGIGDLDEPRVIKKNILYTFPKKGTFYSNGRVLQFMSIANEHQECYDAYSADKKPCPDYPFPSQKAKSIFNWKD